MPKLGCKNCGNCTWLDGIGAVEQVCVDCKFDENGHPTNWRPRKPMTNADRIRSMSDEELAEFICAVSDDDEGAKMVECHYFPAYSICDILEWLNEKSVEVE